MKNYSSCFFNTKIGKIYAKLEQVEYCKKVHAVI